MKAAIAWGRTAAGYFENTTVGGPSAHDEGAKTNVLPQTWSSLRRGPPTGKRPPTSSFLARHALQQRLSLG